jgi:PAS domain S-box-containing protein
MRNPERHPPLNQTHKRFELMRSFRVSAQVLVLVIVPLALQLGLLSWMGNLQSEAEAQLKAAEHSKKIADSINKLNADEFDTVSKMGHIAQLDSITDAELDGLVTRTESEYRELEELSKGEPELHHSIFAIEQDQLDAFRLAKQIRATEDPQAKHDLWRQLGHRVQDVMYGRLSRLARRYEALARKNTEAQTETRLQFQRVALLGGAVTMAISALIGFALATSISLRLNRLSDNNIRLATNRPLNKQMSGRDEIAKIDKTFHKMAKALEDATHKERAVIDNARDLICSIHKGKFSAVNPAAFTLLGYKQDELYGARVIDLIAEPNDVSAQFMASLREQNESTSTEVRMRHKDNRVVDTLWSTQWSDEENSTFCVIHDISERRAAERLRQEIVHMVTHDLRTPLTTLSNIFQLLLQKRDAETESKKEHYLQVGERNVDRLILLVNDLLDIEKIRSGQMLMDPSPQQLDECFATCLDSVSAIAESKEIKLNLEPTTLIVSGDGDKIDRILINLVGNAIKFSPVGGSIEVCASVENKMAKIVVKDQGKGIPADELEKIFERFHQVYGHQDGKGSSGLGLTICRAFVELHGGRIWAESTVGEGTSFCFTLPLVSKETSISSTRDVMAEPGKANSELVPKSPD